MTSKAQHFTTTVTAAGRGRVVIPIPFDPHAVWGARPQHPVGGTINGLRVRGVIEPVGDGYGLPLRPGWLRDRGVAVGDAAVVAIAPDGPQSDELAADISAALSASPPAAAFFDSIAQFYRKAYLRWIDGTKRRPEQRAERIAEMIRLLEAGHKERPKPPG